MSSPVNSIQIFSTSPQSTAVSKDDYLSRVIDVARWSEAYGCEGILVYADNSLVDPWLVAETIACNTAKLCPLVAVQPIYMHPYGVAKMVSSIAYMHGRRLYLNMVAGGFKNDLAALNDTTPHDMRYARLVEYTSVIKQLLDSSNPVTFSGQFYAVTNLKLQPPCPKDLQPGIFVSGSSDAGLAASHALGAIAVQYPKGALECDFVNRENGWQYGVRVGIIARPSPDEAWAVAHDRFPDDRKGELAHQLAMKTSDSIWHRQLSELGRDNREKRGPYWTRPFEMYKTFCPYLVGSYEDVAAELSEYHRRGYTKFILDIPPSEQELQHINTVFNRVAQGTLA
jgi:alkanesulfonate monooxygenase